MTEVLRSRSIVNQQGDHLVVDVGSIVPLCAGVDVFNSLAVGSLDSQLNSLVADLVRILGDGAVEPALTDRVLLGSASVEAIVSCSGARFAIWR